MHGEPSIYWSAAKLKINNSDLHFEKNANSCGLQNIRHANGTNRKPYCCFLIPATSSTARMCNCIGQVHIHWHKLWKASYAALALQHLLVSLVPNRRFQRLLWILASDTPHEWFSLTITTETMFADQWLWKWIAWIVPAEWSFHLFHSFSQCFHATDLYERAENEWDSASNSVKTISIK